MYKLAPSILSANFTNLGESIKELERGGAHYLHIDIMDGHFVPNISMGPFIVNDIRKVTNMTLDVHLMIDNPNKYLKNFLDSGADIITIHLESQGDIKKALRTIKSFNKKASLAIKPNTNLEDIYPYLEFLDMVLIMSVEPGFGGQELITSTLNKALKLSNYVNNNNIVLDIEMDGGIYLKNVRDVINSGVNVVVAGSAIFGTSNIYNSVKEFYKIFEEFKN